MSDIVARLRNCDCIPHCLCAEAANEIERLRDQLRLANIDNFETTAEIERLRAELREARQIIYRLQTNAACCRSSPDATTRDGEAPFIPEAL